MDLVILMHNAYVPSDFFNKLIEDGMFISTKLIQKLLHGESMFPHILHVYFAADLINQI